MPPPPPPPASATTRWAGTTAAPQTLSRGYLYDGANITQKLSGVNASNGSAAKLGPNYLSGGFRGFGDLGRHHCSVVADRRGRDGHHIENQWLCTVTSPPCTLRNGVDDQ
jgi:hypothetical protein